MRYLTAEEVLGIDAEVLGGNIVALAERVAALLGGS